VKRITFNKVCIKNFLSIGNQSLSISFNKGITVITGENKDKGGKNGIGKSTIADAIFWCLFGNTIRELKKDKIQHNKNKEICDVRLQFSIQNTEGVKNYTIIRQLDPAKIQILCETDDITLSTLPKNDEFIKNLIGANEEVFNNAVVMSANNTIPFMAQKKTEKRKFIEGILQLNIFSEMLLKTRSEYNDVKKENDLLSNNFVNLQRNLSTFEDQKANSESKKQEKIDALNEKITQIEKNSEELKNKNLPSVEECNIQIKQNEDKIDVLKNGLKTFKKTRSDLANKNSNIIAEINQLKKEKQKIIDKGNICPTCNREYCKDDIEAVNKRMTDIDAEIGELELNVIDSNALLLTQDDKIENLEDGIDKINKKIRDLEQIKSETKINSQKLLNNSTNIKECLKLIDEIKQGDPSIETNINNIKNELEKSENELKEVKKSMAILDSVKFIVSEEGVKTFIVKKIINILNTRLNYYLQSIDAPCKCVFDEMFEETIYNDQGKECSYFNFSGGERKRIDTAILFTFQDVMRCHSGTSFSLNIYDELFDCALDAKGTDKILEILKEKVNKYDESIYIVSHKSSEVANCDNVIFLEKSNGVTTIAS
jgi:DNA repair exonuclease SbcCD ATPase subunit